MLPEVSAHARRDVVDFYGVCQGLRNRLSVKKKKTKCCTVFWGTQSPNIASLRQFHSTNVAKLHKKTNWWRQSDVYGVTRVCAKFENKTFTFVSSSSNHSMMAKLMTSAFWKNNLSVKTDSVLYVLQCPFKIRRLALRVIKFNEGLTVSKLIAIMF